MYVRVRDDPDYETKVGGVVPDPAIFKKLNSYERIMNKEHRISNDKFNQRNNPP